ncbi:hypothetical protein P781_12485 [Vibrio mimicus CAIM 1883]|nr:hypothetical protein P780_12475 [Vibrio mimicus CAIM 1882]ERM54895.1 hypothetical protein P781_12485 [Vibrio mimicus CAIM 1883]
MGTSLLGRHPERMRMIMHNMVQLKAHISMPRGS